MRTEFHSQIRLLTALSGTQMKKPAKPLEWAYGLEVEVRAYVHRR